MQHRLPVVAELNGEWVFCVSQRLGEGAGGKILRQVGDLDLSLAIGDYCWKIDLSPNAAAGSESGAELKRFDFSGS